MITIYVASKLCHAEEIKSWRDLSFMDGIEINSSWLDLVGVIPDDQTHAKTFWSRNMRDVYSADALFIWADADLKQRGALVEAGMALAFGKPVIVIGDHPDHGTWQHHSHVHKAEDLRQAVWVIKHLMGV